MTNHFQPKPNGRSWLAFFAWIRHAPKPEAHRQSGVLAFTHFGQKNAVLAHSTIQRAEGQMATNHVHCLFVTLRPRHPWSKDETKQAKITENEEANGVGIRHQRQNALGMGN
jgi:hypothetical protein